MKRRRFLYTGAAVGALSCQAGCLGGDGNGEADEDDGENRQTDEAEQGFDAMPRVENPPEAVYLPSHRDGMLPLEPQEAGDFAVSPMVSIPHFFWIMPGPERVEPPSDDAIHLMMIVWDRETGIVLPIDAGSTIDLTKDGNAVSQLAPWPMLSQGMGFHFGDNVPIDGNGTYGVTVSLNPISDVRLTGEFEDRFDERETVTFEFELDDETRQQLVDDIEFFDEDRWGAREAMAPMAMATAHDDGDDGHADAENDGHHDHGHAVPYSSLPPADDLPGRLLGQPTHDDGVYATTLLDAGSRFVDGDERYLAVSPRTPYNHCVIPHQSLSIRLERDGQTVAEPDLMPTLDHELEYHYGTPIDDVRAGDELVIVVETPPQVSRHQGYETAFGSAGELRIELEGE